MNIRHFSIIVSVAAMRTAFGQTDNSTADPKVPAINFQVLKSWKLDLGDRSLFLNRVAPPILPPAPAPVPQVQVPVLTPEQRQALAKREAKKSVTLFMWATVYDHQISELNWSDEHGSHRAFSNVDFNYISGVGGFETPEASYTLMMIVRNETRAERIQAIRSLTTEHLKTGLQLDAPPPATAFNPTRSTYVVVQDKIQPPPTVGNLAALDALHVYFDANKQTLIEEQAKREAANAELERQLKEHPPKPKDTVINYWIGQGATRTLDKRSMGGRP